MKVDRAYFCDTPFQVFTCIHMQLHQSKQADLYVLDAFKHAGQLVDKLRGRNIFRRIVLIDADVLSSKNKSVNKNVLKIRLKKLFSYLRVTSIVESFIEKDAVYDELFFSCNQMSARLARFYYIKKKYQTKFVFFDDGIGSYDGHFETVNFADYLARRLLFGKGSGNDNLEIYLYQPQLYFDYEQRKEFIHRICPFDGNDLAFARDYMEVFDAQSYSGTKNCVFLDTVREEVCHTEDAFARLQDFYHLIEGSIGADKMYVKSHPRAFGQYPHEAEEYPGSDCPLEIQGLSMDMNKMCFISILSTAALSPKIIYDKEPIVLFLCNVDHSVYNPDKNTVEFLQNVRRLYREPERFMVPESMGELKDCLKTISDKLNI